MTFTARDRALAAVVAVLALCGGLYLLVLGPEHAKATNLQAKIALAQSSLAAAQRSEYAGHAAEVLLRRTAGEWSAAQRAVPRVSNIPALLKLLERSATAAHVSMQSITLSSGASGGAATASTGVPTAAAGATAIPIALTFNGGYQALNRLIGKLDTLVSVAHAHLTARGPLVGIGSVSVNPASTTSKSSALTIQLTATIYQHSAASTVNGASASANANG